MTLTGHLVAGRYRLDQRIGGGGMGAVWLAHDERLGRDVAVKQVLPPAGADADGIRQQRERALREGRIAARLSHPHAISVYDVALEDDAPWLVMEYLPSRSLAEVLHEDGLLRVDQAAQIGAQVADALAATHAAGIVHRDVKPANVLIGQGGRVDGVVKITDFGISHASGDVTLTQTGQITGTPAFLAPEVAQGYDPGPAADVFSLAATLFTCLEGEPPFGMAGNSLQQLHRVAAGHINPPQRCGALTRPLLDMMSADPEQRPSMAEVRDRLAAVAAGRDGDRTAVLTAPTDVARTSPQPAGLLPPPATRTPDPATRTPDPASPPTPVPPIRPPRTLVTGPEAGPAAGAGAGAGSGVAPARERRSRTPWLVAAAVVLLAGLGVLLALTLGGDGAGDGTAAPRTSAPAEGTAGQDAEGSSEDPDAGGAEEPATGDGEDPDAGGGEEPAAEEPPPDDAEQDQEEPTAFALGSDDVDEYVDAYHDLVLADPAAAYAQAGPTLRGAISEAGFRDYWGRFDDVEVDDLREEDGGTYLATMSFDFPDGTTQVEEHRFTFVEDDEGQTVLDSDVFVRILENRG